MADKNYITGVFIREVGQFKQLSVGIKVDEFINQLQELKNKKGYVNLTIGKRREPSDSGITHWVAEDTWQPNSEVTPPDTNNSDLPF